MLMLQKTETIKKLENARSNIRIDVSISSSDISIAHRLKKVVSSDTRPAYFIFLFFFR